MTTRKKVSELPDISELTIDDIFPMSDDPSGSPISKKASMQKIVNLLEKGYFAREVDNISDLSSEDAADGYICIVRDLERGGIFKAVNGGTSDSGTIFSSATVGWTWQRVYSGEIQLSWFGVAGDGVTDDRDLIQSAIDIINNNGGKLRINTASEFYKISGPLYWYRGEIEFEDNALIWNTTISPEPFWERTAIMIGSYFSYDAGDSIVGGETAYSINAGVEGDDKVTLVTADDALNFNVGDIVYMHGSETYSNPLFYSTTHVSEVVDIDVDNGYIYLQNPLLPLGIATDGVTNPKIYRNTDSVLCDQSGGSGKPEFAKLAVGVKLINGQFKQSTGFGQCVHISCHKSDLHFKYVSGDRSFGVNPCSYTKISCDLVEYENRSFELTYFHHDVTVPYYNSVSRDLAAEDDPEFKIAEYGQLVKLGNIQLSERVGLSNTASSMSISTPYNYIDNLIIRGTVGVGVYIGAVGEDRGLETVIKNYSCSRNYYEALMVESSHVTVLNMRAPDAPVDTSRYTVRVKSPASNVKILGGYLGESGVNLKQCIKDENGAGSQNIYKNVQQCLSQTRNFTRGDLTFFQIGSGETVIHEYLIKEDSTGETHRNIWKCLLNIAFGDTSGFKKVTVRMVGVTSGDSLTFYTETFLAAETGRIALDLNFSLSDSPISWIYNGNYSTLRDPSTKVHDSIIDSSIAGPDITTEDCKLEIAVESDVATGATYSIQNLMVYPVNEVAYVY